MEVILPLSESYIDALQYHAYFSSILLTNKDNLEFLLSKYINITVRSIFRPHIDFCFQGVLDSSITPINNLQLRGKIAQISEFIITALQNGSYVYVKVNEFYLPHRISYKKIMFAHDILIYGVDTDNKMFYTYGYDDNRRLSRIKYTFDEFEESYYSLPYEWDYELYLFREKQNYFKGNIKDVIVDEYKNYSCSINPYSETIKKVIKKENVDYNTPINISSFDLYGIACYDFIINSLNEYINNDDAFFDPRSLYVLRNQKKVIKESLTLIQNANSCVHARYDEICKKTEICAMLYLKYEFAQEKKMLLSLLSLLKQIKEDEDAFFNDIL